MSRRKKSLLILAASLGALVVVAIVASILVMRTAWFRGFVREKIIAAVEESTGGKVDLASFGFDWRTLHATMTGFVIHGTEPPGSAPLFQAKSVDVKLKLLSGLKKAIDIQYLG